MMRIKKFVESYEIFCKELYQDRIASICEIHEVYTGLEREHHNCLACNFADSINSIQRFLSQSELFIGDINDRFTIFIIKFYLLIEQVEVILRIVNIPEEYRKKHFRALSKVRRWANFLKHPKAFFLVHHPEYFFEGYDLFNPNKFQIIIDQCFIDNYYADNKKNDELDQRLRNKKDVAVLYPDPVKLTKEICDAINSFKEGVLKNEDYKEILSHRSTFTNYFRSESFEDEENIAAVSI